MSEKQINATWSTALVVGTLWLTALAAFGVGRASVSTAPASTASAIPSTSDVYVFTDPLTGCDYLTKRDDRAAITPRLHSDGVQVCDDREETAIEDQADQDQVLPSTQITPYVPAIDGPAQDSPALVQVRFVF